MINELSLPGILDRVERCIDELERLVFYNYNESSKRLLNVLEVRAHDLSVLATKRLSHPYNYYGKKEKKSSYKDVSRTARRYPALTELIIDFGLVEDDE